MAENLTTNEIFKPVACTTPLNSCTFCGWPAELYSRSNADGTFSEKAVMCSNFGDDDPTGNACPLHLPPEDFYHATKREAVEYWNERTARGKERITSAITAEVAELRRDAESKRSALVGAVDCIREWHNMGVPEKQRSELWDIYWRNAPEMKAIRAALGEQP